MIGDMIVDLMGNMMGRGCLVVSDGGAGGDLVVVWWGIWWVDLMVGSAGGIWWGNLMGGI